jgi:hypothetical protein
VIHLVMVIVSMMGKYDVAERCEERGKEACPQPGRHCNTFFR